MGFNVKSKILELENLEDLILGYKTEKDKKRKHILYLDLVETSLQLVKKIVNSMPQISAYTSKDDLLQVGARGLLKAINTYKVSGKGSFKTYATKYIKGKILQYLRDKANILKTSRYIVEHQAQVKEIINELTEGYSTPSLEEISKHTHIPINKIEEIMSADLIKNPVSLDQKIYSDDDETLIDKIQIASEGDFEQTYENKKVIEYALNKLCKTDRYVIHRFYIDEATKKDIAKEINVSAMQVSRILKRALNKMYYIIIENDFNKEEK